MSQQMDAVLQRTLPDLPAQTCLIHAIPQDQAVHMRHACPHGPQFHKHIQQRLLIFVAVELSDADGDKILAQKAHRLTLTQDRDRRKRMKAGDV